MQSLNPTAESLQALRSFPFLKDAKIPKLAEEVPFAVAGAEGVTVTCANDKLT